jgi:hypothetical protein
MKLDDRQRDVINGGAGAAMAKAMKTLVGYGEAFGAARMVPVKSCHLAGTFGFVSYGAYYAVLEMMTAAGLRVVVPTTLNPRPGAALSLMNRYAFLKQKRLEEMLESIGATPNYSCVCYDGANVPGPGDRLAWAESSAVQYANSVLGARTNRNSVLIDICSAITGCTPEFGYLLDERRRGQVLVRLAVKEMDASALGYLIGQRVVNRVPVIEHYGFTAIQLKNMGGAMAAAGGVALFHVLGLTPEAPDMKTVFGGTEPAETLTITQEDLDGLRSRDLARPDLVVFGCPQMTYDEAVMLGHHFAGKKVTVPTWFCMVPAALRRLREDVLYGMLVDAGVAIHDVCPVAALSSQMGRKKILTSSGKLFYYLAGAAYGSEHDCLKASGVVA